MAARLRSLLADGRIGASPSLFVCH